MGSTSLIRAASLHKAIPRTVQNALDDLRVDADAAFVTIENQGVSSASAPRPRRITSSIANGGLDGLDVSAVNTITIYGENMLGGGVHANVVTGTVANNKIRWSALKPGSIRNSGDLEPISIVLLGGANEALGDPVVTTHADHPSPGQTTTRITLQLASGGDGVVDTTAAAVVDKMEGGGSAADPLIHADETEFGNGGAPVFAVSETFLTGGVGAEAMWVRLGADLATLKGSLYTGDTLSATADAELRCASVANDHATAGDLAVVDFLVSGWETKGQLSLRAF